VNPTTRVFFAELGKVWPNARERRAMLDVTSRDPGRVERGARVLAGVPVFDALLRNGISATMMSGGIRSNVIPMEASANLNVRTLPGESIQGVVRRLRRAINDKLVTVEAADGDAVDPQPSSFKSPMFAAIAATARELLPSLAVVPYLSTGATDSARLRAWGVQAYGLLPFPLEQSDEERMHGNDERVPLESLDLGTRLVYGIIHRVTR
jgi:acetylornithine deacetylase/succinyl-diaminopimelate desuccinylase-like protein